MMNLNFFKRAVTAGFLVFSQASFSQQFLPGAQVWKYDDGTIAVRYLDQSQFYTPLNLNNPGNPGAPPQNPLCSGRPRVPDLSGNSKMDTVLLSPTRTVGGTVYSVDLSRYASISAIQLKVSRGEVQIHSAQLVSTYGSTQSLSEFVANRLCQDQGITVPFANTAGSTKLVLKLEGYLQNDVSLSVNIQYDDTTCGGCNSYGCWVSGGGCNSYGCYIPQGQCNSYGCSVPKGGCNSYGCWYPGGSCNSYGCQKPAPNDAGKASNHPTCS